MHYALFASLLTSLMVVGRNDHYGCLLVDPLPPTTADFAHAATGQHQKPHQLGETPAQWGGGHHVQCGYQSLPLFV